MAYITWKQAFKRGMRRKCPRCGEGKVLKRYLKVYDNCESCGLDLTPYDAADGPAYFTMSIAVCFLLPLAVIHEWVYNPPEWLLLLIWLPIILGSSLILLPIIKGIFIGVTWSVQQKKES